MTLLIGLGCSSLAFVLAFSWHQATSKDDTPAGRQTRRQAVFEAWQNIGIGFAFNWVANFFLLPLVHASFTAFENFMLGCVYTAISILRQYAIRRWWEKRIHALAARAAERLS